MQPPNHLKLHKIHEVTFGDSKDMTSYKKLESKPKKYTRKTTQTMSQTTCIKIHKNLQNISLCFRISNHQK
jgi:hypothetical protein